MISGRPLASTLARSARLASPSALPRSSLLPSPRPTSAPALTRASFFSTSTRKMAASIPATRRALQIQKQGGLEVLEVASLPTPAPKPNEVLIKVEWSGANYIENYQRSGIYPIALPFILGNEPAGVVVGIGSEAEKNGRIKVGDRVAAYMTGGGHAEYTVAPIEKVAKLPESLSTRDGAGILLQGLTALTLLREAYPVKKGDWVLVHAAAGGVGLLLCQMASHFGVNVIGTVSTPAKAELAKANGAHHVIQYGTEPAQADSKEDSVVVREVLRLTEGRGVQGVYDGVGKSTWEDNFKLVARKGTIVTFGNASGPVEPFAPLKLSPKNLKVCRPTLFNYVYTEDEMVSYSTELFDLVAKGVVKLHVHKEYDFAGTGLGREGARGVEQSQSDITSRGTTGKLLIKIA